MEGGEEVTGDEEGLVGKRKEVETVEGEREERWGGEDYGESAMVVVGLRRDGVCEI